MYVEGRKHGQGCFTWADQSTYSGDFVDNNIEGFGKCWQTGEDWTNKIRAVALLSKIRTSRLELFDCYYARRMTENLFEVENLV